MYYVYIIQNLINNKVYIGQTSDPKKRWRTHRRAAKNFNLGKKSKLFIQLVHRAMAKYSIENFEFQTLESFASKTEINEAEMFWIDFFSSRNPDYGYNITVGGDGLGSGPDHPLYGTIAHNRLFSKKEEKIICTKYCHQNMSTTQIAKDYNCCSYTISSVLRRNNIEILGAIEFSKGKNYSPETQFKKGHIPNNKIINSEVEDLILKKYLEEKLSAKDIAKQLNCSSSTVLSVLKNNKVNIRKCYFYKKNKPINFPKISSKKSSTRSRIFSLEEELQICKKYKEDFLSSIKLAKEYHCHRTTITDILRRHNIEIKNQSEYLKGKVPNNKLFSDSKEK